MFIIEGSFVLDSLFGHNDSGNGRVRWRIKHQSIQHFFHNRSQTTRTGLSLNCSFCNQFQSVRFKVKLYSFQFKQLLVLFNQRVLWLGQDSNQSFSVQTSQGCNNWQTTNQLRNQTKFHKVLRGDLGKQNILLYQFFILNLCTESQRRFCNTAFDCLLDSVKRTAADKEDLGGINLQKFLIWMLSASIWRNICNGSFDDLQQSLLYAFTADISCNRGVFRFSADFVDLINVDDTSLCALDIPICRLNQSQ